MHTGSGDTFEIGHFCTFQTVTMTSARVIQHTMSCITHRPLLHSKFRSNWKTLWMDRHTGGRTLRPALLG